MSETVLVTGGGGYLGGHICAALHARDDRVRAFDLSFPNRRAVWDQVNGSILDERALSDAMNGVDAVFHCAALADLWRRNEQDYIDVNVAGTRAVATAAMKRGAQLVHVSSYTTLIGGARREPKPLDERVERPVGDLLGPYPQSKRLAELEVYKAFRAGLDACIVMPSSPIGPGDHHLTPPNRMIRDLATGALPALLECSINIVDARAVAQGAVAALDRGRPGERYLLSGHDLPLSQLAALVAKRTGVPAPKARAPYSVALAAAQVEARISRFSGRRPTAPLTGVKLAGRRVTFSNAKAREELGFDPGSVEDALDAALAWMVDVGHIPEPADG